MIIHMVGNSCNNNFFVTCLIIFMWWSTNINLISHPGSAWLQFGTSQSSRVAPRFTTSLRRFPPRKTVALISPELVSFCTLTWFPRNMTHPQPRASVRPDPFLWFFSTSSLHPPVSIWNTLHTGTNFFVFPFFRMVHDCASTITSFVPDRTWAHTPPSSRKILETLASCRSGKHDSTLSFDQCLVVTYKVFISFWCGKNGFCDNWCL